MPRLVHLFDLPERFVAGTVGVPGERTFFLQAVAGPRVVSVALEKVQVAALTERLAELLDELRRRGGGRPLPGSGGESEDVGPLVAPVEEEFRVGAMALAWDGDDRRVVVEAMARARDDQPVPEPLVEDVTEGPDVLRVRLSPGMARAFVRRAHRVLAAGRQPCYLCARPLDPAGHQCARLN